MSSIAMQPMLSDAAAAAAAAAAAKAEALKAPQPFGPMSSIGQCPGNRLPMFRFAPAPAASSAPPKSRLRRVSSADRFAAVPDQDNDRLSPTSSVASELHLLAGSAGFSPSRSPSLSDLQFAVEPAGALVPSCMGRSAFALGAGVDPASEEVQRVDGACLPSTAAAASDGDSLLDVALTALWDDAAARGLFRYNLSTTSTRVVPGRHTFVAQLNEGRATKKRPTECRLDAVVQPFDEAKFNFKKAAVQEVLFQFEPLAIAGASPDADPPSPTLEDSAPCNASPNLVVINVSPIEYGHVLLVPRVMDCLPQLVDPSTLMLALAFAREAANPALRVGYNSLGAYATINHLHYQAYYLAHPFPCELAPTAPLQGIKRRRDGITISRLTRYPVNGFVVELDPTCPVTEESSAEVAQLVGNACLRLQAANVPHNLLICEGGRRVFLFPQCFAERQAQGAIPAELLETQVNPAAFEIAGHVLLKRQQDYDSMQEGDVSRLLSYASLPEDRFLAVGATCFGSKEACK